MTEQKHQKMSSWLLWRPLKFAILSIATMTLFMFAFNMIAIRLLKMGSTAPIATILVLGAALLVATVIYIWRLPRDNYDRHSFVALNTAQLFLLGASFLTSSVIIIFNAQSFITGMWMMRVYFNPYLTVLMLAVAIFYMYLMGLGITNIYIKYRRVRAMGVAPWRALCAMPFGFSMLWIAGYILPGKKENRQILPKQYAWYEKLVNWIMARPLRATSALAFLIIISGTFFQFENIIITLAMGVIFAVFWRIQGTDQLHKNIPGRYSTWAIVMNIATLIVLLFISATPAQNDVHITMQDTLPAPEITQ